MKRAAEFLLGGAIVYVAMAAQAAGCAGSGADGGLPSAQAGASGGGDGGFGGAPGNPSGGNGGVVAQAGSSGSGGSGGIFDPVPTADAKSGTRLKAKVYRGVDGAEQSLFRWQDTERNEECAFAAAADGKVRCLPSASPPIGSFADAGCTLPAVLVSASQPCAVAPTYLSSFGGTCSSAGAGMRIFQRGASPTALYAGTPAACNVQYASIPAGYVAYGAGAEVPPSSFAEVTVETLPLGH